MRRYDKEKRKNPFAQGFRLGLIFGSLGALIILGRDHSPRETLGLNEPALIPGATPILPAEKGSEEDNTRA